MEGDYEELLVKARFEEARIRDFSRPLPSGTPSNTKFSQSPKTEGEARKSQPQGESWKPRGTTQGQYRGVWGACFSCGSTAHLVKNCPQRGRGAPAESRGKTQPRGPTAGVAATVVSPKQPQSTQDAGEEARAEPADEGGETVEEALSKMMATLHGVNATGQLCDAQLGSILLCVLW